jgi:hypothetical protein
LSINQFLLFLEDSQKIENRINPPNSLFVVFVLCASAGFTWVQSVYFGLNASFCGLSWMKKSKEEKMKSSLVKSGYSQKTASLVMVSNKQLWR